MRYISKHADAILLKTDGSINKDYNFNPDGVLVVGSLTTDAGAGNAISPTGLFVLYPTDLDSNTVTCLEMCGMGSLTKVSGAGSALTNLSDGYRGYFYPAPVLTGTSDAVSGTGGIRYKVLSGTVTYAGTDYGVGEIITTDGSTTATTGTGTFAVYLPQRLEKAAEEFLTEEFKIKSLLVGDEPNDYWRYNISGAESRNSLVSTDSDFVGWTR